MIIWRQQVGLIRLDGWREGVGSKWRRLREVQGGRRICRAGVKWAFPMVSVIWRANGKIDGLRQQNKTRGGDKM